MQRRLRNEGVLSNESLNLCGILILDFHFHEILDSVSAVRLAIDHLHPHAEAVRDLAHPVLGDSKEKLGLEHEACEESGTISSVTQAWDDVRGRREVSRRSDGRAGS